MQAFAAAIVDAEVICFVANFEVDVLLSIAIAALGCSYGPSPSQEHKGIKVLHYAFKH